MPLSNQTAAVCVKAVGKNARPNYVPFYMVNLQMN